jgi:hypothetical protein
MVKSTTWGSRLSVGAAALALGVAGGAAPAIAADDGDDHLSTRLTGEREIPGPGDRDGKGSARVWLKRHHVCFTLKWNSIRPPTAAHIHVGDRGVAGPVVVTLFSRPGGLPRSVDSFQACRRADADLLAEIRDDPTHYYVNIHNARFPGGAIRGQLD